MNVLVIFLYFNFYTGCTVVLILSSVCLQMTFLETKADTNRSGFGFVVEAD